MDVLILLRHGKAEREAESDRDRSLTARGAREAMLAGAEIVRAGLKPDRILVSPAQRTRDTYAALAAGFKATPDYVEALYMATAKDIWDAANASGGETVLVIGHNPGLHELASTLAERSGDKSSAAKAIRMHLPTSAFAAFALRGDAPPRLLTAWSPKD